MFKFVICIIFCLFYVVIFIQCAPASIDPSSTSCTPNRCPHSELCRASCPSGCGPLCASAKCVNNPCRSVRPCSICQCTNASQCAHPMICEDCKVGYGPFCAQSVCIHGSCHIISPCSREIKNTTQECNSCFHPDYCEAKCPNGTYPLCADSKCVNGKCVQIAPCSLSSSKQQ